MQKTGVDYLTPTALERRNNAVMTQVYNDAGNLQHTGYSLDEAQPRAAAAKDQSGALRLRDPESGVSVNGGKIAPNAPCALKSGDVIELGGRRKLELG